MIYMHMNSSISARSFGFINICCSQIKERRGRLHQWQNYGYVVPHLRMMELCRYICTLLHTWTVLNADIIHNVIHNVMMGVSFCLPDMVLQTYRFAIICYILFTPLLFCQILFFYRFCFLIWHFEYYAYQRNPDHGLCNFWYMIGLTQL